MGQRLFDVVLNRRIYLIDLLVRVKTPRVACLINIHSNLILYSAMCDDDT